LATQKSQLQLQLGLLFEAFIFVNAGYF